MKTPLRTGPCRTGQGSRCIHPVLPARKGSTAPCPARSVAARSRAGRIDPVPSPPSPPVAGFANTAPPPPDLSASAGHRAAPPFLPASGGREHAASPIRRHTPPCRAPPPEAGSRPAAPKGVSPQPATPLGHRAFDARGRRRPPFRRQNRSGLPDCRTGSWPSSPRPGFAPPRRRGPVQRSPWAKLRVDVARGPTIAPPPFPLPRSPRFPKRRRRGNPTLRAACPPSRRIQPCIPWPAGLRLPSRHGPPWRFGCARPALSTCPPVPS